MFRISYIFQEIGLGASISYHDDAFRALAEGRLKAVEIARALSVQIPGTKAGDIEIHCKEYDPQLPLDHDTTLHLFNGKKPDTMSHVPKRPTLKSLNVTTGPKKEED